MRQPEDCTIIARVLCRVLGHRLMRIYVWDRVRALQCVRCFVVTRLRAPGLTDEEIDASGVHAMKGDWGTMPRGTQ
jgi:hypothetical protein